MPKGQKNDPAIPRKTSGRMASQGFYNPIDVHVGRRIRLRRSLLGLSQSEVANAMGLTFQQVQKYERGANRVSSSRLFDIARILDVPISYFYAEMSTQVSQQSPASLMEVPTAKLPLPDDLERDPMARRETLELVRAYYKIKCPDTRKYLAKMVKSIAKGEMVGV